MYNTGCDFSGDSTDGSRGCEMNCSGKSDINDCHNYFNIMLLYSYNIVCSVYIIRGCDFWWSLHFHLLLVNEI